VTPPRLAAPGSGTGFLGSLAVPAELWWAAREPAPLAGMSYPSRADWAQLAGIGFHHVVCLSDAAVRYDPAPLTSHCFALQDLYVSGPDAPDEQLALVAAAVDVAGDALRRGEGVLVHCQAGRGRTGTVIGGVLVRLGHDPESVIDWLHRLQRVRSKRGWPEHPWQADAVRACAG
jgi:hypothetical protein